jgi:hypothetical protein
MARRYEALLEQAHYENAGVFVMWWLLGVGALAWE